RALPHQDIQYNNRSAKQQVPLIKQAQLVPRANYASAFSIDCFSYYSCFSFSLNAIAAFLGKTRLTSSSKRANSLIRLEATKEFSGLAKSKTVFTSGANFLLIPAISCS